MRRAALLCVVLAGACHPGTRSEDAADASSSLQASQGFIEIGTVGLRELGPSVEAPARLTFDDLKEAHIFSPVTGRVTSIEAEIGQDVRAGDTLATIRSPDLAAAQSDVNKANAELGEASRELLRQRELAAARAGVRRDLDLAREEQARAEAEAARARANLQLLTGHGDHVDGLLFRLTSPIDGRVVAHNISPGLDVQGQFSGGATVELFTVGRRDSLWAIGSIFEQDLHRVRVGAPAHVRIVALPDASFDCQLEWVSGIVELETRTVEVRCTLDNPRELLKAGMFGTMTIDAPGRTTLAVPRSAILHLGEKTVVIVSDEAGTSFERRPVIVDESEPGDWVPVQHGLQSGEHIVTSGALLLSARVQ